jgi:hypothetical protein
VGSPRAVRAIIFSKSHYPREVCFTLSTMLTDREKSVLEFEGSWWLYPGPKDRAIRDYLTMSATRYYQILRRVLDHPEAIEYAPLTVRRLRRVRDESRERRVIERFQGGDHPSR